MGDLLLEQIEEVLAPDFLGIRTHNTIPTTSDTNNYTKKLELTPIICRVVMAHIPTKMKPCKGCEDMKERQEVGTVAE